MKDKQRHPWLSVVIPVYNAAAFLPKCINSILRQNYSDFEVLLIDDGSTDQSSDICVSFSREDPRIHYFRKNNRGPFQTRVFGIEHAQGQYITFCDADDFYANERAFQTIYEKLQDISIDVMQFAHRIRYIHLSRKIDAVKKEICIDRASFIKQEYPLFLCSSSDSAQLTLNVWNKVYKKELFDNLPPSETAPCLFWGDDLVMNLIALETVEAIKIIPDVLYVYRDLTGGTTKYSKNEMKDLNLIKDYQRSFINRMAIEDKAALIEKLHCETACWFAVWVKEGIHSIDEAEMTTLTEETLLLPSIQEARQFFQRESKLKWEQIELLRRASAQEYIEWAKKGQDKKSGLKDVIKRLYKTI